MRKSFGAAVVAAVLLVVGTGAAALAVEQHGAPACSASGTSLALTAKGHKFDKDCLAVPAGGSFTIRFDNQDSDRHSLAIVPSRGSNEPLHAGNILAGPKSALLTVPKLKDGTYLFQCDVHPNLMNGTFIVGEGGPAPSPTGPPSGSAATPGPAASSPATPSLATDSRAAAGAGSGPSLAAADDTGGTGSAPAASDGARTPAGSNQAASGSSGSSGSTGSTGSTGSGRSSTGPDGLPRTGPLSRPLLLLAGIALAAGGLAVAAGVRQAPG